MLLVIHRGPFGVSSVSQYGQLDPEYPHLYGKFAEDIADHEIAEKVFAALADDLQADGLITKDGKQRLMRRTPMASYPQQVVSVSPISALAS